MNDLRNPCLRQTGLWCVFSSPSAPALLVLVAVALLLALSGRVSSAVAQQGDPSAAYLQAYLAFQDAVRFEKKADTAGARRKYEQSLALFDGVKRSFPSWNPRMVDIRTSKVKEALQMLSVGGSAGAGFASSSTQGGSSAPVPSSSYPVTTYPPTPPVQQSPVPARGFSLTDQIQHQIDTYEAQIRQLQAANYQVRQELDSQKQVAQNSVAKIAAAKNQETSALRRIAALEQELVVTKQSNSEVLALMEEEKVIIKGQLEKAGQKESTALQQIDRLEQELAVTKQRSSEALALVEGEKASIKGQLEKAGQKESTALQEIERLEQELLVARESDSQVLASMEEERALLKSQLEQASKELKKANEETSRLFTVLEESKAVADRFRDQRDAVIKERDQMAIIMKTSREGSEQALQELVAKNSKLQEDLQAALKEVETLAEENQGKDKQIAQLESQVKDVRTELATIKEKASGYVATIADLETRLETTMQMLQEEEGSDEIPEELVAENELLRGLIVRQLRQQVRQQQTNELVQGELERLEGSSQNLIDRVARLTDERPTLSDAERELLEKYDLAPVDDEGIGVTMVARVEPSAQAREDAGTGKLPAEVKGTGEKVESPQELAARAEDAFFARNFERAEKLYEEFMKTDPVAEKHGIALANLGVVRMRLEKFGAAQQALTKARAIHPDNAFIHFMLGMSYFWQGENDDALLALENASQLDPMNVKVHQYIGVAATRLGELERAEKGFLEAIALDPRFAPAHFNLAVIYATGERERDLYDRAEQHYLKALDTGAERDPLIERLLNEAKAVAGDEWPDEASG